MPDLLQVHTDSNNESIVHALAFLIRISFIDYHEGLCVGTMSVVIPMYLAEITEEKIRGGLSNLFPLMAGLGILNTYELNTYHNVITE